ncbi:MAG: CHAT domain-containing tetratricopeptide repeat protein, partial [Bacteroidota bacterium]
SAIFYYNKALAFVENLKGGSQEYRIPSSKALILLNLSTVHYSQKAYQKALETLEASGKILAMLYPAENYYRLFVELQKGINLSYLGETEKAVAILKRCHDVFRKNYGPQHEQSVEVYYAIGNAYRLDEQHELAISYYDSALLYNKRKILMGQEIYTFMELGIGALHQKFLSQSKILTGQDLTDAISDAVAGIRSQLGYVSSYLNSEEVLTKLRTFSFQVITHLDSLYTLTSDDTYLADAWELSESSKAGKISSQNQFLSSLLAIGPELRLREKNLRDSIQLYVSGPQSAESDSMVFLLGDRMITLRNYIRSKYPDYFNLRYQAETTTLPKVQAVLPPNNCLISFFTYEEESMAFVLANGEHHLFQLQSLSPASISGLINDVWRTDKFGKITHLTIAPDGELWNFNFDLIPSPQDPDKLLIEDIPIQYIYSAPTLLHQQEQQTQAPGGGILAFSYAAADKDGGSVKFDDFRSKQFAELPGSTAEIRQISEVMEGTYYYGKMASEKNFKKNANDYSVLHLAVHGDVTGTNPNDFKLVFYDAGDSTEDGSLHAKELYQMRLNARFAVLSACNTGAGQQKSGEGLLSLGRAFAFAGVNSLMLTREQVSDVSTPLLMQYFYEGLNDGMRKSEALRLAKLRFLADSKNETWKDPAYWSPYFILGDDSPVSVNSSRFSDTWLWALAFAFALCCFGYYHLFSKKRDSSSAPHRI